MTAIRLTVLEDYLDALANGQEDRPFDYDAFAPGQALPVVATHLKRPMAMDRAERIEAVFKRFLRMAFAAGLSGEQARFVAEVSKDVGFVSKFKPYGVKCATVLGYSIFFLRPGMGFSFQRHRTRKTELFHMLGVLDRGQVYLSSSREWDAVYERDAFNQWLSGKPDARYQAYSRKPEPGDVYLVTELDTVHSVLGCVLEEYATVSVDLVDRLHDQNSREHSPFVDASTVAGWLATLPRPMPRSCWQKLTDPPSPLPVQVNGAVEHVVLADTGEFLAERFEITKAGRLDLAADPLRARSLFCLGGRCRVLLRGAKEPGTTDVPPVALAAGQVIIVGPGIRAHLLADEAASLSAHTIKPSLALDA